MRPKQNFWKLTKGWTGLFLLFLAQVASGAPVWVSTTIPSSEQSALFPFSITADSHGELFSTFYEYRYPGVQITSLGHTENGTLQTDPIFPLLKGVQRFLFPDRLISVNPLGRLHAVSVNASEIEYAVNNGETWEKEIVAHSFTQGIALATDRVSQPHLSYVDQIGSTDALYYGVRQSESWSFVSIASHSHAYSPGLIKTTMDVNSSGSPTIASFSNPVRVFTQTNGTWNMTKSFPLPWGQPTLRIDELGRTHLVLSSISSADGRYLRWDSSGTISVDQSIPLAGLVSPGATTDMAIDNANQAWLLIGNIAISPSGELTQIPPTFFVNKMTLVKNQYPFYMGGQSLSLPLVILSTCIGGPPGQPQMTERSTGSITWSFVPSTGAVLGYQLLTDAGVNLSELLDPSVSTYTETGIAPNQSRRIFVRAVFPGMVRDSPLGTTVHALTVEPKDIQLTRLSGNTLSSHWETGGNTVGTVYRLRLTPPQGEGVTIETTNQSAQLLLDPGIPYALTLAAVNGDGLETFVSSLTHVSQEEVGAVFSFDISGGMGVDIALQGSGAAPQMVVTVTPADSFPTAPSSFGSFTPSGVGFDIPTSQAVPAGQTVNLTLRYPEGRLNPTDTLILARFDSDRNQWIPLASQSNRANRQIIASTKTLGLFQVMIRTSLPTEIGNSRVYPNPFHPAQHKYMTIQEVPAGTQVRILSAGGLLVREFTTSEGSATWDGRDGEGNPAHSGVYVLRLEQNGQTKNMKFVMERP